MSDPSTTTDPDTAPDSDTDPGSTRWSLARLGVYVVVASFLGVWGYVMYLTVVEGREEPRDRLEDTAWTETADAACARSTPEFASIPFASEADTPTERAGFLDAGTEELETMVGRLESLPPPTDPAEADAVESWLDDYRAFIVDRREYAASLEAGDDEAFTVTDRGGYQLDVLIDDFARVNYMENCETPDDVG